MKSFDVYVEVLDNPCYKQEKFTDTVNVFPFLCSIVRNCRDFHIQRKAKTLLIYIFITVLLFCFYIIIVNINFCRFRVAKIRKLSNMAKFILTCPKCSIFVSTANQRYALFPNLQNKFRRRWITFPIIIFSTARPVDRAAVDPQPRRRNCAVSNFPLSGRRGFCNFVGRITILYLSSSTRSIKALCVFCHTFKNIKRYEG